MPAGFSLEAAFLTDSINDIQATIRQVDVKVGFLVFFSVYPAFHLPDLVSAYNNLPASCFLLDALVLVGLILWLIGIFATIRTLMPVVAFEGRSIESGARLFSGPAGSKLTFRHIIFDHSSDIRGYEPFHISDIHERPGKIIESLLSEQAKLSYIRDIKIYRSKFALLIFGVWLALGLFIWVAVLTGG